MYFACDTERDTVGRGGGRDTEASSEMDTPDKNQSTAGPLSLFEDSPVFKYISNLSPIEPVKSAHSDLNSLTFGSPSCLFSSPQLNCHRETRFSGKRYTSPDPSKSVLFQNINENNTSKEVSNDQQECYTHGRSDIRGSDEQHDEKLDLSIVFPKAMKYDCGSPVSQIDPCDEMSRDGRAEIADNVGFVAQTKVGKLNEIHHPFETEADLQKICGAKKNIKTENLVAMISDAADVLCLSASVIEDDTLGRNQKIADPGTISFISNILQSPEDCHNNLEHNSVSSCSACIQSEMGESVKEKSKETGQAPVVPSSSSLDKVSASNPTAEVDIEGEMCSQTDSKYCSKRRRCLVFEMAGAHRKKTVCDSIRSCSTSSPSTVEVPIHEKHLDLHKTRTNYPSSMSSGIGLHLNTLAATSINGKISLGPATVHGTKLIRIPGSMQSAGLTANQSPSDFSTPSRMERELLPCDHEVVKDTQPTSVDTISEEFDIDDPNSRRPNSEDNVENNACKRCNCRRSKCLKLYCDCFAAGLYCVDPCSCQDCLNKPLHVDTVLATRRHIEARDPLAFAPKVIRSAGSAPEFGDEHNNKTPASARHKRGCNCKRSSCLKKYCECYQGGVGCSQGCRCEGCKNTFGQKDGANDTEVEEEDTKSVEPEQNSSLIGRLSNRKKLGKGLFHQLKFSSHLGAIPEDEAPEAPKSIYTPVKLSPVKLTSLNCKRLSPPHQEASSDGHKSAPSVHPHAPL